MFQKIEEYFVCIGLLLLILLVFLAAVLRMFGIDMSWSTDLAQLTFAWVCFIGADLAMRVNRHMGVDLFVERFPLKVQKIIKSIILTLVFCFMVFVIIYGVNLSIINRQRHFNTLPISYSVATISAPVGCLLMAITSFKQLVKSIKPNKGIE